MNYKIPDNTRVFRTTPGFERNSFGVWHISRTDKLAICGYLCWHDDLEYAVISDTKNRDKFCINCFPKQFERVE